MLKAANVCAIAAGFFLTIVSGDSDNVACTAPPVIYGAVSSKLEGHQYRVGTEVIYECKVGYNARGSGAFLSVCKIDEETGKAYWTHPNILCTLIYCPPPPDPVNGRVLYISLEYGTELGYECNHGFVLKSHQPRICTGDGTWSNDEPQCIESACEKPDPPVHGSMRLHGEPKVGSLALFSCDDGTTMFGASISMCLISGVWTFDPPKCLRSCKITDVENGVIGRYKIVGYKYRYRIRRFFELQVGIAVKHNETVVFRCKEGYFKDNPSKGNIYEVMCNDGMWNETLECKLGDCFGDPPPVENASPVIESRSHGSIIWYRCDKNFFRKEAGRVECNFGIWTGHPPACGDSRCNIDELNFPGLLTPDKQILRNGNYFEILCKSGYKRTTVKREIRCTYGKWDIDRSPCEIEICYEAPPPVNNGKVSSFDLEHGSLVQYECDEHFEIINNSSVRCEAGTWVGHPPTCQKYITCSKRETYNGLLVSYTNDNKVNSIAKFHCSNDGILVGSELSRCQYDGTWSHPWPKCENSPSCRLNRDGSSPLIIEPVKEHYRFGDFILLRCPRGQKLTIDVERVMCLGQTWSDDIPDCKEIPD